MPPPWELAVLDGHPARGSAARIRFATISRKRIEQLPEVPTVAESGFKGYEVDNWYGLVAPAKTPKETLSQLETWFTGAMQVSEVRAKLAAIGLFPDVSCGSDFSAHIRKKYDEYGRVIREANIKWE
jgi:tripartite-type tricarboxylate transporter receptor subunit TctC